MNKRRRTELTLLLDVLLLLSGIMLITILVSSCSYGFSACANQHQNDDSSITSSCHRESFSSIEDPANNNISDSNSTGIMIIGHNGTTGVHLVGKVKFSSLPSTLPTASEGQQVHVIPFHPKNLTSFLAEKSRLESYKARCQGFCYPAE
jgi:hypothetical protein